MTKSALKTSTNLSDGLINCVTGAGTAADKLSYAFYGVRYITAQEVDASYRTSGLSRKVHDLPPSEMTREWRLWQADIDDVTKIEREEKRLKLRDKAREALLLARMHGGALIVMGLAGSPNRDVRAPSKIRYVHVFNKESVSLGEIDTDMESPYFGEPSYYEVNGVRVHPSRCIPVVGQKIPRGSATDSVSFWGDPLLMSIESAVKNADSTAQNIAAMVQEAKVDIVGIPGLTNNLMSREYEQALMKRMQAVALFQSSFNVKVLDSAVKGGEGEKWETRQLSFSGLPEVQKSFNITLSAVVDIPYTRLFGESAGGLNSSGQNEQRDFERMIRAKQDTELRPILERMDDHLIMTALGNVPDDVNWRFAPLSTLDEVEAADVDHKNAQTWKVLAETGAVPTEVIFEGIKSQLIESGRHSGVEAAYADANADLDIDPIDAPEEAQTLTDAAPRPLYVQRKLKNTNEFTKWAKDQGFNDLTPDNELHVTVLYSREAVDWMAMGETWNGNDKGEITVQPGGARLVEPLGDKGAIVLLFNSSELAWRHSEMVRNGASHDYPDYQPHVTITYSGTDVDLSKVEPYRGKLVFGPEIFEELNLDWSPSGDA